MKRDEVLQALAKVSDIKVKDIHHQPTTRIEVTPDMVVLRPGGGGRTLEMTEEGAKSMATFAGIPTNLIHKISPRTFSTVATELLDRQERYSVLTKDGAIVAFDKPRGHRVLTPERVLQTIEQTIPVFNYQRVTVVDPANVALEVVAKTEKAVVRGDLVRAGALITFSPVGTISPSVQSYVSRLVCTNGAISRDYLDEYRYSGGGGGEGDDIYQWFRQAVRQAVGKLEIIVERWQNMRQEKIDPRDRATLLEGLIKEARLPDEAANAVRALALQDPPRNSYQMMNLITYASSHLLADPRQVRHAQKTAATYDDPATHIKVCPVCQRNR